MRWLPDRVAVFLFWAPIGLAYLVPAFTCSDMPASEEIEYLADQPAESLAGKLQRIELPADQAHAVALSVRRIDTALESPAPDRAGQTVSAAGPTVLMDARARTADDPRGGRELTVARLAFRVASRQDAGYVRLEHRDGNWYESTFWQGGEQWLRVGRDWHHPGERGPSVRRFLVPNDGLVTVTGPVRKAHLAGDGVRAAILHNDRHVWDHTLAGDDGEGLDPDLSLSVHKGDTIRFVVDKRGSIACDTTYWDPVITYADGQRFQASEAFDAKKQGAGGWYYETPAEGYDTRGVPRLAWFDADWALCESPLAVGQPVELHSGSAQPCAVLADGQDVSGIALAFDSKSPWRLSVLLQSDGMLTVDLSTLPAVEDSAEWTKDGQLLLSRMALGPYLGSSSVGMQRLERWLRIGETMGAGSGLTVRNGVGSRFRATVNHVESSLPENDSRPLAERDELPVAGLRASLHSAGISELDYWAMIQQDWHRQDQTDRQRPETYRAAAVQHLEKARQLVDYLQAVHGPELLSAHTARLQTLALQADSSDVDPSRWYLQVRRLKRDVILANPLLDFGPLLFCKRVPTSYSHLVMQHYGWRARPGGGLFVLDEPGRSLRCRDILVGKLETGNVLEPRLSYDGQRIVFSYVDCPSGPLTPQQVANNQDPSEHYYHIWEVNTDGTGLRRLTEGPYDDLMPCYLPDGGIAFMSTRRKGYARCFGAQFSTRWDVYTLHRMESDGSAIRTLSYHDTNEWYPAVSHTGHILYARWDYIDRDAVTHQNLWASRPDGTNPVAVWGNATPNPHCTFQAQPVPGSQKLLFTASAHHSITAGAIALLDPTVAVDGLEAIERITPEIPFPESESMDIPQYYAAPWPLSENFYLVAYSPYPLEWEPRANRRNALGLYVLDRWNNRELIYRDPEIGSTNPCPLRARDCPPALPSVLPDDAPPVGEMLLTDVTQGLDGIAADHIKQLRIVQIFPKTTNLADNPPVGAAREENGRAVLGTVPVEADGSARFLAPAHKLLLFQALDEQGNAYQTMRTVTYLQAGEQVACVGCHEHRRSAPPRTDAPPLAMLRPASQLEPGEWGGRPFSYVQVVQPVLDQHCVVCHGGEKTDGDIDLTGQPLGHFTRSYHALMQDLNAFWGNGTNPDNARKFLVPRFGARNQIQITPPGGLYGARGSRLMQMLRAGHEGVELSNEELRRLALWIDLNAIFYGVHEAEDQQRMRRGEWVGMPEIQ
jgi:hypothetical protein